MKSRAATTFQLGMDRAAILYRTVGHTGLRPQSRVEADAILHAALAAATAAWNFYIPNVIRDFRSSVAQPLDVKFHAQHTLLAQVGDELIKKFNTPNAENSRNLIMSLTGYDPIGDWSWFSRGLNGVATRERLNEILKVRHSFAHGFTMPAYSWTTSASGQVQLRKEAVKMAFAFFRHLVSRTDRGISHHLKTVYSTDFK